MVINDSFDPATESNRKQRLDPHVPEKRKKKNSGVKTVPDPIIDQVDEEASLDETDEQIPTVAERKSSYHFVFLILCM